MKVIAYHGSNVPIRRFNREFSAQGMFWFSEDRAKILRGESGAVSSKYIMTVELSVTKTAGWPEYDKLMLDQIQNDGYDSIKLDDDWVIFDAKNIKVKKAEKISESIGPFELQVETMLLPERKSDALFVREANVSFKAISDWFDKLSVPGRFWSKFVNPGNGSFSIDAREHPIVRKYFPGVLQFKPNTGSSVKHGIGHTQRSRIPVMVFQHYKYKKDAFSDWFPEQFHAWWKHGLRDVWIHEYTHWKDSRRNSTMFDPKLGSAGKLDNQGAGAYYNDSAELQAYYVEAITHFFDTVKTLERRHSEGESGWQLTARAKMSFGKNWKEFLDQFLRDYADQNWIANLTPQNRKRIIKRAATSYRELKHRLDKLLPRNWQRWTTNQVIAAMNAEKAAT